MAKGKIYFTMTKFSRVIDSSTRTDKALTTQKEFEEYILDDPQQFDLEMSAMENLEIVSVENFVADVADEDEDDNDTDGDENEPDEVVKL